MIKDFLTSYWGFLPTTTVPYPAHPKVNAFIGSSGHGKTTIWDGLRLVLGDTTFENNRMVSHYVHPTSNWAIIRVKFDNMPVNNIRPYEKYGFREDEVVVCCRVFKNSSGGWNKEYYVFDGDFRDLNDLAQNPRAYKQRLKTQEGYRKILEDCMGITPALRRLMAMNPEKVRDMVNLEPNQLFNRIFELKGIKEIKNRYVKAKERFNEQEIVCGKAEQELEEARKKYDDYKEKAAKYQDYQVNLKKMAENDLKLKKIEYWEVLNAIEQYKSELNEIKTSIENEQDGIIHLNFEGQKCVKKLEEIDKQINEQDIFFGKADEKYRTLYGEFVVKNNAFEDIKIIIDNLSKILPQSIDVLKELHTITENDYNEKVHDSIQLKGKLNYLEEKYTDLEKDKPPYPPFVSDFIKALQGANIDYVMLADAISVKEEHKKWQKAVEAYLGNNRFRVIVNSGQYVEAKKIQEKSQYTARVSLPKGEAVKIKNRKLPFPTIRSVIEVTHPEKIGGYLTGLENVYLVDTVEEGHQLQQQGLESITRAGLLQDYDGAVFRKYYNLCCGRLAILSEKEQVESDLKKQIILYDELENDVRKLKTEINQYQQEIKKQEELLNLPVYKEKAKETKAVVEELDNQTSEWLNKRNEASLEKDRLHNEKASISKSIGELSEKLKSKEIIINDLNNKISNLNKQLSSKNGELLDYKSDLFEKGLTENDISYIPQEVQMQPFKNEQGEIYQPRELRKVSENLKKNTDGFRSNYPGVDEHILTLVKTQEGQVDIMATELSLIKRERESWSEECNNSLFALRKHIKETINEYIEEFHFLASLLEAQAKGRLEEKGEDPELWELFLSIGFDGKKPTPINGPELSSGQRACTSLMILLAAMNNRRESLKVPIMFLDEPRARLDDDRGNEVGQLLQVTDVQYFITHQQGQSLKTVDWINHAFSCSLCLPGEQFAPPMIFKRMRSS